MPTKPTHPKGVWRSWELLRVPYNLALLLEGLGLLYALRRLGERVGHHEVYLYGREVWSRIFLFGIAANLLYCLGPSIEFCVERLRHRRTPGLRRTLFVAGLLFSMYLVWGLGMRMWSHVSGYGR